MSDEMNLLAWFILFIGSLFGAFGVYELIYRPDLHYRIVLNESIDLAKRFGADQGHRYVNGVLDCAAKTLRANEFGQTRPAN